MRRVAGLVLLGAVVAVAACNALTGASDLSTAACPECGPAGSSGSSGTGSSGSGGEGGFDAPRDAPKPPPNAALDGTFGQGGVVLSNLLDTVTSVALRSDGRIVVAGASAGQLAVVQLAANGAIDPGFGSGGRVIAGTMTSSRADAVSVDSAGRVLAAGVATTSQSGAVVQVAYLVRIANGGLDPTFASMGRKVFTSDGEAITAIAAESAFGGYVVGGRAPSALSGTVGALWQLTSAGAFVDTMSPRVDVSYAAGSSSTITAMIGGGAAPLLVAGSVAAAPLGGATTDFAAARLTTAGYDTSFSGDGKIVLPVGASADSAFAVARFADDSYLVGGDVDVAAQGLMNRSPLLGLVRVASDGGPVKDWGNGGKVVTAFALPGDLTPGRGDHLRGVAVDSTGRVIAVGYVEETKSKSRRHVAVLRLGQNATSDVFFGTFGLITDFFDPASTDSAASAVVLQPDGKMVVVGTATGQLAVARINP